MTWIYIVLTVIAIAGVILLARWVYLDAKNRGVNPLPWVLLTLLVSPNFIGLIVYALVRPKNRLEDNCESCGAQIPADCNYCPKCGVKHEPKQGLKFNKGPGLKLLVTGAVMLAAALIIILALAFTAVSGISPFANYTIGSVENKIGNSWSMSFHTLQGSQSASFTAQSDTPHIVYSSQITQGEMSIEVFDQNNTLIANIPVNEEGILNGLVKGTRYKLEVSGKQARGKFSFSME